jgi:hypothetical protein
MSRDRITGNHRNGYFPGVGIVFGVATGMVIGVLTGGGVGLSSGMHVGALVGLAMDVVGLSRST